MAGGSAKWTYRLNGDEARYCSDASKLSSSRDNAGNFEANKLLAKFFAFEERGITAKPC